MSSLNSYIDHFKKIYVAGEVRHLRRLETVLERLRHLPLIYVDDKSEIPGEDMNSHTLFISGSKGETVGHCPASRGHLCCNYITVDLYLGCIINCSYCIMKSYLNFAPITIYLDTEVAIKRIIKIAENNKERTIRVGTGEVGDSLLLDPVFRLSEDFIRALSPFANIFLELKTKTHFVDHLLDLENKGNTVISFSLNPEKLISRYEGIASTLAERVQAARKIVEHGYLVSFHFDPLFLTGDWQNQYAQTISSLKDIPQDRIAWISLGTMRYTKELKQKMGSQDFLLEEFIPCRDGKYRYLQKTRSGVYRYILKHIRKRWRSPIPVYLCMESRAVWRNVFGRLPREIAELSAIFKEAQGCLPYPASTSTCGADVKRF